jgi:hypothetical protein
MLIKQFEERFDVKFWLCYNLATMCQSSKSQNGHAICVIEGQDSRHNILMRTCKVTASSDLGSGDGGLLIGELWGLLIGEVWGLLIKEQYGLLFREYGDCCLGRYED